MTLRSIRRGVCVDKICIHHGERSIWWLVASFESGTSYRYSSVHDTSHASRQLHFVVVTAFTTLPRCTILSCSFRVLHNPPRSALLVLSCLFFLSDDNCFHHGLFVHLANLGAGWWRYASSLYPPRHWSATLPDDNCGVFGRRAHSHDHSDIFVGRYVLLLLMPCCSYKWKCQCISRFKACKRRVHARNWTTASKSCEFEFAESSSLYLCTNVIYRLSTHAIFTENAGLLVSLSFFESEFNKARGRVNSSAGTQGAAPVKKSSTAPAKTD